MGGVGEEDGAGSEPPSKSVPFREEASPVHTERPPGHPHCESLGGSVPFDIELSVLSVRTLWGHLCVLWLRPPPPVGSGSLRGWREDRGQGRSWVQADRGLGGHMTGEEEQPGGHLGGHRAH